MMRDQAIGLDHDRAVLRDLGRPQHGVVGGQCTDAQLIAVEADVAQLIEAPDVDQPFGAGEAQIEHGNQALPAGENLGLSSVSGEGGERRRQIGRALVLEWCRLHAADSPGSRRATDGLSFFWSDLSRHYPGDQGHGELLWRLWCEGGCWCGKWGGLFCATSLEEIIGGVIAII